MTTSTQDNSEESAGPTLTPYASKEAADTAMTMDSELSVESEQPQSDSDFSTTSTTGTEPVGITPSPGIGTRQRQSYRYSDQNLRIMHNTSVPLDDEEAFEYAGAIRAWGKGVPRFLEAKDFGPDEVYKGIGEIQYAEDDEPSSS